ncbi:hypothetical protein JCM3766R1_004816 [Sporobolomyces carnicolor]
MSSMAIERHRGDLEGLLSALKLAKPGEGYPKEMCKQFDKMIEAVMELRSGESISIEQRVVNQCVELVRKSRWVWLYKDRKIPSFPADPYWKPLLEAVYYQSWTGFSSIVQRIPTLEGARCRELTKAFRKVDKIVWKAVGDEVANRHRTTVCTWLRRNDASEEQLRQVVTSLEWLIRESRKATARQDSLLPRGERNVHSPVSRQSFSHLPKVRSMSSTVEVSARM